MRFRLIMLLLCCALLSGCTVADPIEGMATPATTALPAPVVEDLPTAENEAALWFRFGEEPLLAPERRLLTVSPTESLAHPLLRTLLEGPSAASMELQGLFPQGTKLVSLAQSDGVIFVTLSHHIMSAYPDEPDAWQDDPYWAVEVPLRRKLAMQSIAATLTENCGVDTVIILVAEEKTASDSLRLKEGYYLTGGEGVAAPLTRDESLLLTPNRTAEVILQCWQEADWVRLYRYIARTDPANGDARPAESDFPARMASLPHLLHFDVAGGSISGDQAVFTVAGAYLDGSAETSFEGRILRLTREKGLWRVGLTQLTEGGASK